MVNDDATASDNCGEVTIDVSSETISGDAAGNYTVVRTFTATDDAGNSTSAQQTITVQDTTAPELSIPADYTSECDVDLMLDDATASDNCGEVTIDVSSETISGDAAATTRLFARSLRPTTLATALLPADPCPTPRLLSSPSSLPTTVSARMDPTTPRLDNCGEVTSRCQRNHAGDARQLHVAHVHCDGRLATALRLSRPSPFRTTAPELSIPADYTSECSDLILDDATASDNCGEVTIEVSSETTAGDAAGNYTIVRTVTATDDAGNSDTATQTITVQDTTAPTFTFVPADYTVECSDEMPMDDATATDNCGEVTIEVSSETTPGDAAGNYTIVRTFTATDDAGNSASATQTICQDTTAPEFTFVPADYTVECSDEMPMDDAVAADNCGEVTIEVSSETTAGDAAGNYTIVRVHSHRRR